MYRILSLAGGGVKGYLTLNVLKHLEEQSNRNISDMFDLVVGTSSGALIGALLDNHSTNYLCEIMRTDLVNKVFKPNLFSFGGLVQPKYDTVSKVHYLKDLLYYKTKFNNFDYAAVSYDIKNNKPVIFNTLEQEFNNNYDLLMNFDLAEACIASSAAPIYWHPCLSNNRILVDGGICCNNPTSVAIKLALNSNVKLEDICVVSIGTGLNTRHYNLINGANPLKWMLPLFNTMLNGQSKLTDMFYQNENIKYFNLDTELKYSSDDIDCTSESNFNNLLLDTQNLILNKQKDIEALLKIL